MMVVEIVAGIVFGSMALLADGLHMGSHALALAINVVAYVYARRRADSPSLSFGTGKVNSLGGFCGAILLGVFTAVMVYESVARLIFPVDIAFTQAIAVAVVGLIVNAVSLVILKGDHHHHHDGHEHHDHNLISAYLHVLADTLTSLLAIIALLAALYLDWVWLDPIMGLVGAMLIARWSWGLLRTTSRVLLDFSAGDELKGKVRATLERNGATIVDLHVWAIGPEMYCVVAALEAEDSPPPQKYRDALGEIGPVVHASIEINPKGTA